MQMSNSLIFRNPVLFLLKGDFFLCTYRNTRFESYIIHVVNIENQVSEGTYKHRYIETYWDI